VKRLCIFSAQHYMYKYTNVAAIHSDYDAQYKSSTFQETEEEAETTYQELTQKVDTHVDITHGTPIPDANISIAHNDKIKDFCVSTE